MPPRGYGCRSAREPSPPRRGLGRAAIVSEPTGRGTRQAAPRGPCSAPRRPASHARSGGDARRTPGPAPVPDRRPRHPPPNGSDPVAGPAAALPGTAIRRVAYRLGEPTARGRRDRAGPQAGSQAETAPPTTPAALPPRPLTHRHLRRYIRPGRPRGIGRGFGTVTVSRVVGTAVPPRRPPCPSHPPGDRPASPPGILRNPLSGREDAYGKVTWTSRSFVAVNSPPMPDETNVSVGFTEPRRFRRRPR